MTCNHAILGSATRSTSEVINKSSILELSFAIFSFPPIAFSFRLSFLLSLVLTINNYLKFTFLLHFEFPLVVTSPFHFEFPLVVTSPFHFEFPLVVTSPFHFEFPLVVPSLFRFEFLLVVGWNVHMVIFQDR